jgi:alkaline phosphatase
VPAHEELESRSIAFAHATGEFLVTGQVPGEQAVHTATDIPLSAFGPGALAFTGVIDNTDVFFKLAQAAVKGVTAPADASGAKRPKAPVVGKP